MAGQRDGIDITMKAAADLSAKQYHIVEVTDDHQVNVANAITDIVLGVLQNKPDAAGKAAVVRIAGTTKVVADGAITVGSLVGTSADGQADAIAAGTETTVYILGIALEAAAAAGDIIEIALLPRGRAA